MEERTANDECALPLQEAEWRPTTAVELPSEFFPLRLVLQPSGYSIELNQPDFIFGRHSKADLRLPLPDVSRRHCRLVFIDGSWQLFDLSSLNGTFVNGQKIQQIVLQHRDSVRLGGCFFEVHFPASHASVRSGADRILYSIAEALPPEQRPNVRRAS